MERFEEDFFRSLLDPERAHFLTRDELKDLKRKVDRAYLLASV
ncbi:hypothetical protein J3R73_002037 [Labrys monachus]|uniref:Uncharacterized protein n=1 Tax=Labrys monachus TaxID=217067 RepID=A0ABU0FCC6_9HYPH|nr:hypothetical protein [Labrys monachus]